MRLLEEGLRINDLKDMVLPLISVDEFESKISDDAIVFGFFVQDEAAANDLDRFIQKSPINLIDTDISPAPDSHGYYIVFVEILRNNMAIKNFDAILTEIMPLVGVKDWQMQIRGEDDLVRYEKEALERSVKAFATEAEPGGTVSESIGMFLHDSLLQEAEVVGRSLYMKGLSTVRRFEIIDFGLYDDCMNRSDLGDAAVDLDPHTVALNTRIAHMLGENWQVHSVNRHHVIQNATDHRVLLMISQN